MRPCSPYPLTHARVAMPCHSALSTPTTTSCVHPLALVALHSLHTPPLPPARSLLRRVFGWSRKNEIPNGRWVMMGWAIGLMTEYATGKSFIDQFKLMASYMGLVDMD